MPFAVDDRGVRQHAMVISKASADLVDIALADEERVVDAEILAEP